MGIVEKLVAGAFTVDGSPCRFDLEAVEKWPNLWELLTLVTLPGGRGRIPSTLKISLGRSEWQVAVNDEDTRQTLLVASQSLTDTFVRVEALLTNGEGIWRQWPPLKGQPRKR